MIQVAGLIVRAAHAAGGLLLFGTLMCLLLAGHNAPPRWRARWQRHALLLSMVTGLLAIGVLAVQAAGLPDTGAAAATVRRLLLHTRFGAVWSVREVMLALLAVLVTLGTRGYLRGWLGPALGLAGAQLAAGAWAGHAAAAEPVWPTASAHTVHLLAIGAWWGALPALASYLRSEGTSVVSALQRFSLLALPLMVMIVTSGVALAWVHVERWPALFGTPYGAMLGAKVALLTAVLLLAARLRWRLLPGLAASTAGVQAPGVAHWIVAESLLAAAIVAIGAQLTQTVPARHDEIAWWLPLRLSVDATWDAPWVRGTIAAALVLALAGLMLLALSALRRARQGWTLPAAALSLTAAGALAVYALAVDAYPDTYRRPSVPYQTISVSEGARLFAKHCTGCHGRTGKGDGELERSLPVRPADLTEPHTALHTAGDIFWWLTHGKPPGIMPGFAGRLSEDERWDVINFLRTLSSGYQARILTERVVPGRPWLPAIDFNYTTQEGASGTLKDFRERSAVLLVFFALPGSGPRMAALARDVDALRRAGAVVLAISMAGDAEWVDLPVVAEGAQETAVSYALLRRTLEQPDSRDEHPIPDHMEVLVDRFGYVRARWLPDQGAGWQDTSRLIEQIAALAREPQVRPPPDDHVH